jgi:5-methylthioadenosine/S-adenosylhomocysteine deaminase
MFEEIRLAAFVAKAVTNDPTSLPASTALTMATRLGARALHLGDVTGSLAPGMRADLILIDLSPLHNSPSFRRGADNVYAQIVYAGKSMDVTDVMCNGKWLMQDHKLLTLQEADLLTEAAAIARKIDAFLIDREGSILSKLIALGGSMEQESFEVQVKVKIEDKQAVLDALKQPSIQTIRYRHYGQHDTYFTFRDPEQGRLRYREDDFLDETGAVVSTRGRLTLLGLRREWKFEHDVLLSRSRLLAPATQSLRFYREYFRPDGETMVTKDRERWLINFRDTEFFVNVDEMREPPLGRFVEVKSRTWSRRDAEHKAALTKELLNVLGLGSSETVANDYIDVVEASR